MKNLTHIISDLNYYTSIRKALEATDPIEREGQEPLTAHERFRIAYLKRVMQPVEILKRLSPDAIQSTVVFDGEGDIRKISFMSPYHNPATGIEILKMIGTLHRSIEQNFYKDIVDIVGVNAEIFDVPKKITARMIHISDPEGAAIVGSSPVTSDIIDIADSTEAGEGRASYVADELHQFVRSLKLPTHHMTYNLEESIDNLLGVAPMHVHEELCGKHHIELAKLLQPLLIDGAKKPVAVFYPSDVQGPARETIHSLTVGGGSQKQDAPQDSGRKTTIFSTPRAQESEFYKDIMEVLRDPYEIGQKIIGPGLRRIWNKQNGSAKVNFFLEKTLAGQDPVQTSRFLQYVQSAADTNVKLWTRAARVRDSQKPNDPKSTFYMALSDEERNFILNKIDHTSQSSSEVEHNRQSFLSHLRRGTLPNGRPAYAYFVDTQSLFRNAESYKDVVYLLALGLHPDALGLEIALKGSGFRRAIEHYRTTGLSVRLMGLTAAKYLEENGVYRADNPAVELLSHINDTNNLSTFFEPREDDMIEYLLARTRVECGKQYGGSADDQRFLKKMDALYTLESKIVKKLLKAPEVRTYQG